MIPTTPIMIMVISLRHHHRHRLLPAAQAFLLAEPNCSRGRDLGMMGVDSRETRVVEGDFGSDAVLHLPMTETTTVDRKIDTGILHLSTRRTLGRIRVPLVAPKGTELEVAKILVGVAAATVTQRCIQLVHQLLPRSQAFNFHLRLPSHLETQPPERRGPETFSAETHGPVQRYFSTTRMNRITVSRTFHPIP
jgi:hypothetical protein